MLALFRNSKFGLPSTFDIRNSSFQLILRLFDHVACLRGLSATADLALEDWRRVRRNQLVILQNEFGIKSVAGRFVNRLSAEVAKNLIFIIVVLAEIQLLAIGRELFLFIQHHKLGGRPRLSRATNVAPKFEVRFVIASTDVVITWRF